MSRQVILTGLRTNAEYHLGNYLGAILPMVELQKAHIKDYQVNMFAPDLHSFTTEIIHGELFEQTIKNLKVFIAAGMPIENNSFQLYRQSYIPAHSELTVILNNFAYFGRLKNMTQFKEKTQSITKAHVEGIELSENFALDSAITAGLFDYPVLMAADILLYSARYIPVGDDQKQHIELARELAIRLNNKFGDLFVVPENWTKQLEFSQRLEGVRIRSLRSPDKKMSKSIEDPNGTIKLSDKPEEAAKKIKSAETDSLGVINWDWEEQPGITNLLQIYELLSGNKHADILNEWTGKERYGDLKTVVAKEVSAFLTNFQSKLEKVTDNDLQTKLESSEKAMNIQADETLLRVQKAVGLRP